MDLRVDLLVLLGFDRGPSWVLRRIYCGSEAAVGIEVLSDEHAGAI